MFGLICRLFLPGEWFVSSKLLLFTGVLFHHVVKNALHIYTVLDIVLERDKNQGDVIVRASFQVSTRVG